MPRSVRGLVDPSQPSAEPFRSLRLALELRRESRKGNLLIFTSSQPGEGKSTIASNYSVVASLNQQRLLLVDADLRHPVLHEIFGVPRSPGLVEVLAGEHDLQDCTHRIRSLGHLELLTAGRAVTGIGDLMSSERMRTLLAAATKAFDTVVLDTPPVLAVADAAGLAAGAGGDVALVVDHTTRRRSVARTLRELDVLGANVLGLVVNHEGELSRYGYS